MFAFTGVLSILFFVAAWTLPLVAAYFVIRLAVCHGVVDAHRKLGSVPVIPGE